MLNPSVDVQRAVTRLLRPSSFPAPSASDTPPDETATTPRAAAGVRGSTAAGRRRIRSQAHRIRPSSPWRTWFQAIEIPTIALPAIALPAFDWHAVDPRAVDWRAFDPRTVDLRSAISMLPLPSILALGHERTIGVTVAAIVLAASVVSVSPAGDPGTKRMAGDTGGPAAAGEAPRIAIGGTEPVGVIGAIEEAYVAEPVVVDRARFGEDAGIGTKEPQAVEGNYLDDGTLLKPIAVDTSVADGSDLVRTYRVKSGDTLSGIAKKFGVSMKTLYWANDLKDRHELHLGQRIEIPPVSGLVVEVKATDTLASLAKKHDVSQKKILKTNGLEDENLVVGQVLVLPGAKGEPLPTPKPTKKPSPRSSVARPGGGGSGGSSRPPRTYTGGRFAWPAPGGHISQYYHYGHYGIDIDGSTGDRILAAAGGTVTFAGWKSNGGGYQVWIAHGSGLHSTYNHMSSVAVGRGQHVGRGQRVGRMGATGYATGSHLHFEVWRGPVWNGGRRVNPLSYLR